MKACKGYYSLIQYCPDRGRAEVANVGVLVFCPETGFIDALVSKSNHRVERVFGRGAFDPWWINNAKRSLQAGIRHDRERLRTVEDVEQFIATRGNDFVFTAPRVMRIEDAEADLRKLFSEWVGERRSEAACEAAALVPRLDGVFRRLVSQRTSVQIAWSQEVPEYSRRVRADYYYENGTANLVRLLPIGPQESRVFSSAVHLGGEGIFVANHLRANNKQASLTVVAAPPESRYDRQLETRLQQLFRDFPQTRLIPSNEMDAFAHTVEREAH